MALLLGLFVTHLGFRTMERMRTVETRLAVRTDALVAARVARHVLRRELTYGRAGEDWLADADSVSLRAFRGTALLCPRAAESDELTVLYAGDRSPDPSKDSVLLVDPEGRRETRALVGMAAPGESCGSVPTEGLQAWRLDVPAGPTTVLARLFERGSYHLSSSALRYRRGVSGRQPLTPEVWSSASRWIASGERLELRAEPRDPAAGRPWEVFLAWLE